MKRITLKQVNKAIHAKWPHVVLLKENGYFYIIGTNKEWELKIAALFQSSIYVNNINHQPLERWVKDVEFLLLDSYRLSCDRIPAIDAPN